MSTRYISFVMIVEYLDRFWKELKIRHENNTMTED